MLGIFNKRAKKTAVKEMPLLKASLDSDGFARLLPYFPIGNKLNYFPEFKQELMLNTAIIAYAINNELVYSNNDISWQEENGTLQLYLLGKRLKKINSFCFIMPTVGRGEEELDYVRKERLGKDGGFIKGNNITLNGKQSDGRLPVLDATVRKQLILKEGHFVGHKVAILDVDPKAFKLIEQRRHVRLKIDIVGEIQTRLGQVPQRCTMVDFSDHAVRIIYNDEDSDRSSFREGSTVTLSFDLPKGAEPRVIRGKVIRQHDATVVMTLDNIKREKDFEKVELFDIMEIKANLLQQQQL
ncbi:MAG: PilZ domain-containing protein [Gammaproteobacteria bacterium]|nr:PilZ domain-containing protein [Gammaproteobacteria bacterium]